MTPGRLLLVVFAVGVVGGCRPTDQRTDRLDVDRALQERASWPSGLAELIDAGNAAVRVDSFDVARRHFLAATELAPAVAAGWFGLYMAEQGRGDAEAAVEALGRARSIAPGASLIHPEREGGFP